MGDKTLLQNEGGRLGGSLKDTQSTLKHFSTGSSLHQGSSCLHAGKLLRGPACRRGSDRAQRRCRRRAVAMIYGLERAGSDVKEN